MITALKDPFFFDGIAPEHYKALLTIFVFQVSTDHTKFKNFL